MREKKPDLARWEKELGDWMRHNNVTVPQPRKYGGLMSP
jgi:hypothetical protein